MLYEMVLSLLIGCPEYKCVRWAWRDDGTTRYVWCLKWEKTQPKRVKNAVTILDTGGSADLGPTEAAGLLPE